jgi:predicted TIM-barrel fold metal-dependent hydrolase
MDYPVHSAEMTYTDFDGTVFDADNHFYEAADAFTRYLPRELSHVVQLVDVKGRTKIALRGRISDYIPNPTFEVVAAPGSAMEYFAGRNDEGKSYREIVTPMRTIPEFTDRNARLALLDRMHIDATLNFPTLASLIEVNFMDDPQLTQTIIHAFNQWMFDEWGFNHQNRLFTTPVMNLSTVEGAIAELEWALERDAKVVLVRPAPVAGPRVSRSPFLPEFDPFWARMQESGTLLVVHASDSGYQRYVNDWLGRGDEEHLVFQPDPFTVLSMGDRPVMDTVFSAVTHGMLSRFPELKMATIELGSRWLPRVVEDMLLTYKKMPHQFPEHPLDIVKRQLYVAPFWEDPLGPVVDILGPDHILFSSDWPHPEGLADPVGYVRFCRQEGLSEDAIDRIMGANMFDMLGLKAPASSR